MSLCCRSRLKPLQCRIGLGIGTALVPGQRIIPAHQQNPVNIGGISTAGLFALCQHPHRIAGLGHGAGEILCRNGHHIGARCGEIHCGNDGIGARHRCDGILHIAQLPILRIGHSQVGGGIKVTARLHPDGISPQGDHRVLILGRGIAALLRRRVLIGGTRLLGVALSHSAEHLQQFRLQLPDRCQAASAQQNHQGQNCRPIQAFFLFPASFIPHSRLPPAVEISISHCNTVRPGFPCFLVTKLFRPGSVWLN